MAYIYNKILRSDYYCLSICLIRMLFILRLSIYFKFILETILTAGSKLIIYSINIIPMLVGFTIIGMN